MSRSNTTIRRNAGELSWRRSGNDNSSSTVRSTKNENSMMVNDEKTDILIWKTNKILGDLGAPPTSPITSKRKKSSRARVNGAENSSAGSEAFTEEPVADIRDEHNPDVEDQRPASANIEGPHEGEPIRDEGEKLDAAEADAELGAHLNAVAKRAYFFALQEAEWQSTEQFGPAPSLVAATVSGSDIRAGRVKHGNNNKKDRSVDGYAAGARGGPSPYDRMPQAASFDVGKMGPLPPSKLADPNWAWTWEHGWGEGVPSSASLVEATAAAHAAVFATESNSELAGGGPPAARAVAAAPVSSMPRFSDLLNHPSFQ
mmetsp:Transcript_48679/g.83094  ORF Transcript_48679/g.83094 Transcript_48679/m.83094 type:complete len:315 (+) Transcript_48679:115-1059(+)